MSRRYQHKIHQVPNWKSDLHRAPHGVSPDTHKYRSCIKKIAYPGRTSAEKAARKQYVQDKYLLLAMYKCRLCSEWHLTSKLDGTESIVIMR